MNNSFVQFEQFEHFFLFGPEFFFSRIGMPNFWNKFLIATFILFLGLCIFCIVLNIYWKIVAVQSRKRAKKMYRLCFKYKKQQKIRIEKIIKKWSGIEFLKLPWKDFFLILSEKEKEEFWDAFQKLDVTRIYSKIRFHSWKKVRKIEDSIRILNDYRAAPSLTSCLHSKNVQLQVAALECLHPLAGSSIAWDVAPLVNSPAPSVIRCAAVLFRDSVKENPDILRKVIKGNSGFLKNWSLILLSRYPEQEDETILRQCLQNPDIEVLGAAIEGLGLHLKCLSAGECIQLAQMQHPRTDLVVIRTLIFKQDRKSLQSLVELAARTPWRCTVEWEMHQLNMEKITMMAKIIFENYPDDQLKIWFIDAVGRNKWAVKPSIIEPFLNDMKDKMANPKITYSILRLATIPKLDKLIEGILIALPEFLFKEALRLIKSEHDQDILNWYEKASIRQGWPLLSELETY
jgi:hypothetical protein